MPTAFVQDNPDKIRAPRKFRKYQPVWVSRSKDGDYETVQATVIAFQHGNGYPFYQLKDRDGHVLWADYPTWFSESQISATKDDRLDMLATTTLSSNEEEIIEEPIVTSDEPSKNLLFKEEEVHGASTTFSSKEEKVTEASTIFSSKEEKTTEPSSIFSSKEEKATEVTSVSDPYTFQYQETGLDMDDNASVMSNDTVEMNPEKNTEVVVNFTDALYERTRDLKFPIGGSSIHLRTLLEVKIKTFSETIKRDNPRGINELKPRRRLAKAIDRLRLPISTRFAQRLLNDRLHSTESETEDDPERPFHGFSIPVESREDRFRRWGLEDTGSQTPLPHPSHDLGSSDSYSVRLRLRPDFEILHKYIKDHPAFEALVFDVQRLTGHFHYDALKHIRHSLSQSTNNASNSSERSGEIFQAQIHADWDLLRFLEERQSGGMNDDLASVLTITGNTQAAQLDTVAGYIRKTWDARFDALLPFLQEAISGANGFPVEDDSSNTRVAFEKGKVSVSVTGSMNLLVAVAQQLAWLGATCRPSNLLSTSKRHRYCDTIWSVDDAASDIFYISYLTVPADEDEIPSSWTKLLDASCMAPGYKIRVRSENEPGLQLPVQFLGIQGSGPEELMHQDEKRAGASARCFIEGGLSYDLETVFKGLKRPSTLASLEQEVDNDPSVFESFRKCLTGLTNRYEQTETEQEISPTGSRLGHVVADLLDADPNSIAWSDGDTTTHHDTLKSNFEDWTKEDWNWWPFKRPQRALDSGEARLSWTCMCGEKRWAEVPASFAETATRIAKSYAPRIEEVAYSGPSQSAGTPYPQPPPPAAGHSSSTALQSSTTGGKNSSGPGSSSSGTRLRPGWSSTVGTQFSPVSLQHIFLLVAAGNNFRLAQIRVDAITEYQFFFELRRQYINLRPLWRQWLSLWEYSHCDFYRCDKYASHRYEPRREEFPDGRKPQDYQYDPNPMEDIPPAGLGPHHFYHRFHACYNQRLVSHFYHKCGSFDRHSRDLLKLFPKCNSTLIEDSEKQEAFWGLVAREQPSIFRLLLYNFICASPCIIFFFMWLFSWGHDGDLQNASVPLAIMVASLSVFWGIYFANLEFKQGNTGSRR